MGKPKPFERQKLIVGIMYCGEEMVSTVMKVLQELFGETDCISEEYVFSDYSTYYDGEMGDQVRKHFVSFRDLVDPSELAAIKLKTNELEQELSIAGDRHVNIDPCILSHGSFTMATTKGTGFRVPLSDGIYADLSLVYARSGWMDFMWTYADVKSEAMKAFLTKVRKLYLKQRKA